MNHDPINEASRRSTFMFCVSSYSYSSLNRRLCTVFENEQKMSHLNFHSKTFAFLAIFFNYLNFRSKNNQNCTANQVLEFVHFWHENWNKNFWFELDSLGKGWKNEIFWVIFPTMCLSVACIWIIGESILIYERPSYGWRKQKNQRWGHHHNHIVNVLHLMEATADAASAAFRQERRDKNGLQKSSFPRIYMYYFYWHVTASSM